MDEWISCSHMSQKVHDTELIVSFLGQVINLITTVQIINLILTVQVMDLILTVQGVIEDSTTCVGQ